MVQFNFNSPCIINLSFNGKSIDSATIPCVRCKKPVSIERLSIESPRLLELEKSAKTRKELHNLYQQVEKQEIPLEDYFRILSRLLHQLDSPTKSASSYAYIECQSCLAKNTIDVRIDVPEPHLPPSFASLKKLKIKNERILFLGADALGVTADALKNQLSTNDHLFAAFCNYLYYGKLIRPTISR